MIELIFNYLNRINIIEKWIYLNLEREHNQCALT